MLARRYWGGNVPVRGKQAVPMGGPGRVPGHAAAKRIHEGKLVSGPDRALLGGLPKPVQSSPIVFACPDSLRIHLRQPVLGAPVALVRQRLPLRDGALVVALVVQLRADGKVGRAGRPHREHEQQRDDPGRLHPNPPARACREGSGEYPSAPSRALALQRPPAPPRGGLPVPSTFQGLRPPFFVFPMLTPEFH